MAARRGEFPAGLFVKADTGRRNSVPDCLRMGRTFRCPTLAPDGWPALWGKALGRADCSAKGIVFPDELAGSVGGYLLGYGSQVLAVVERGSRRAAMVAEPDSSFVRAGCAWRECRWALADAGFDVKVV